MNRILNDTPSLGRLGKHGIARISFGRYPLPDLRREPRGVDGQAQHSNPTCGGDDERQSGRVQSIGKYRYAPLWISKPKGNLPMTHDNRREKDFAGKIGADNYGDPSLYVFTPHGPEYSRFYKALDLSYAFSARGEHVENAQKLFFKEYTERSLGVTIALSQLAIAAVSAASQGIGDKRRERLIEDDPMGKANRLPEARDGERTVSINGRYEQLVVRYLDTEDGRHLELNERFEHHLSLALLPHAEATASSMVRIIQAAFPWYRFNSYEETISAIDATLAGEGYQTLDGQLVPDSLLDATRYLLSAIRRQEVAFTEEALIVWLKDLAPHVRNDWTLYTLGATESISVARNKVSTLAKYRSVVDALPDHRESRLGKEHFNKIYSTVKVNHMILDQMGYSSGSIEFKSGIKHVDNPSYLLNIMTRWYSNIYPFAMLKGSICYATSDDSPLPFNNQTSISIGLSDRKGDDYSHAEIAGLNAAIARIWNQHNAQDEPALDILGNMLGLPARHNAIWNEFRERPPLFHELLELVEVSDDAEWRKKAIFSLFLGVTWNRIPYIPPNDDNPFRGLTGLDDEEHSDVILGLAEDDIKDPEIVMLARQRGVSARHIYASSLSRGRTAGARSNTLITPLSASLDLLEALRNRILPTVERYEDSVFERAFGPLREKSASALDEKRNNIFQQALAANTNWLVNAQAHKKPIYTGPSGHALNFVRLYSLALDVLHQSGQYEHLKNIVSLEDARLFQLADLMAPRYHHSYDEIMTSTDGVRTELFKPDEDGEDPRAFDLGYAFKSNYADMFRSPSPVARHAARSAKLAVIREYSGNHQFRDILTLWNLTMDAAIDMNLRENIPDPK